MEFGEDCLVRSTLAPKEVNHSAYLEGYSRTLRPRSFSCNDSIILLKRFLVLTLQQYALKDGVLHIGTFSAHTGH
jgi:hypothetical protein